MSITKRVLLFIIRTTLRKLGRKHGTRLFRRLK